MGSATAAWWLVFGLCFLRIILIIVLIKALKNFWNAVKKEDRQAEPLLNSNQKYDLTEQMQRKREKSKSQRIFVLHLIFVLVYLTTWIFFASELFRLWNKETDEQKLMVIILSSFILSKMIQFILLGSILYSIYWIYRTGEKIKD